MLLIYLIKLVVLISCLFILFIDFKKNSGKKGKNHPVGVIINKEIALNHVHEQIKGESYGW